MMMQLHKCINTVSSYKKLTIAICSSLFLSACGTSYKVHTANHSNLSSGQAEPGLYYYLPKTRVIIEAIASGTKPEYGLYSEADDNILGGVINRTDDGSVLTTYAELLDYNEQRCANGRAIIVPNKSQRIDANADHNYSLSNFSITTQAIPDQSHLYRLDIAPSALASFSHKIVVNEDGIISAATSTVTEAVSPFIYNSVKSAASFAVLGGGGLSRTKYCNGLSEARKILDTQQAELDILKRKRMAVVDNPGAHVDGKAFEIKLKLIDEEISNFKTRVAEEEAKFGKKIHKVTYVLVGEFEPDVSGSQGYQPIEWAFYQPKFEAKADDTSPKRISFLPGTSTKLLDRVQKPEAKLVSLKNKIIIELEQPVKPTSKPIGGKKGQKRTENYGYKYRIPEPSRMSIKLAGPSGTTTLATSNIQIAQFGAVVSLPDKFFGSKGTLDLAFNPKTGGLTSATIGADPISSTAVSQYVDVMKDYKVAETAADKAREAEAKAEAEAALAAASSEARADIDATLIEIERLEALKKLRDLKIELGLPVE